MAKLLSTKSNGKNAFVDVAELYSNEPYGDKDDKGLEIKRCRRLHHRCRHRCNGVAGEVVCLPCLDPSCIPPDSSLPRNNEVCSICYTCNLEDQPCVQLGCGHVYHADCILDLVRHRWSTIRITFAFLDCPSCKRPIELVKNATGCDVINNELDKMYKLKHTVEIEALAEAEIQGLDKDERLKIEGDYYFGNLQDYAMHACAFYECYECKGSYFGGMIDCVTEQGMEDNTNRKDLLCKPCRIKACKVGVKDCELHSTTGIEWKCNFCCSVAKYHCFGTTYFCEKHHNNASNPIVEKCKGGEDCPLGIAHPPNSKDLSVSTFPLGCALCRSCFYRQPKPA